MHHALEPSFQNYGSGTKEVTTPICDADKKILKHNTRKHALYDMAYRFCDDLFFLDPNGKPRQSTQSECQPRRDISSPVTAGPGAAMATE